MTFLSLLINLLKRILCYPRFSVILRAVPSCLVQAASHGAKKLQNFNVGAFPLHKPPSAPSNELLLL